MRTKQSDDVKVFQFECFLETKSGLQVFARTLAEAEEILEEAAYERTVDKQVSPIKSWSDTDFNCNHEGTRELTAAEKALVDASYFFDDINDDDSEPELSQKSVQLPEPKTAPLLTSEQLEGQLQESYKKIVEPYNNRQPRPDFMDED